MLNNFEYEKSWRETPPKDRLKFIADRVFEQGQALARLETSLVDHDKRLTKIENRKHSNTQHTYDKLLFYIATGMAATVAGVVTYLKLTGWIK